MNSINYGALMINAMQQVVIEVLAHVQENGLPDDNHFVIEFSTDYPRAQVPPRLLSNYPKIMTIVIQHWFEDLEVGDHGFSITLNFGDQPERLFVPIDSVRSFSDPSANFNLNFPDLRELLTNVEQEPEPDPPAQSGADSDEKEASSGDGTATVVNLEQFRNRPK